MTANIPQLIKDARLVSTPFIAVATPDQHATEQAIIAAFNGNQPPVLRWNVVTGIESLNPAGDKVLASLGLENRPPTEEIKIALTVALELPARSLFFIENAHRWTSDVIAVQAIANLRQPFLSNTRTLVLLGPSFSLPVELTQDVLALDEALPDDAAYGEIVTKMVEAASAENAKVKAPDAATMTATVKAMRGLAAFPASQVVSLGLAKHQAVKPEDVWTRKLAFIEQTKGISVLPAVVKFSDIGGMDALKQHFLDLNAGPDAPSCYVTIQEIEKLMAGVGADNNGIADYILKSILDGMEDNGWTGLIEVGGPGTGKTVITQALPGEFLAPGLDFDIGAVKESHVGDSEANIRAVMKMLKSIGGASVYFVATCNGLTNLKPELKRRFTDGVWYVDLPTDAEKLTIWHLNLRKYFGLKSAKDIAAFLATTPLPDDANWTGAEIRNCVRNAWRKRRSLVDAALGVIPVALSDGDVIKNLRTTAQGRWLCATTGQAFTARNTGRASARAITTEA